MPQETRLGQFIPVHYHYQMLLDEARMRGFQAALDYNVPEGGRVLDLGGGTGVLAFFAARRARRVYCVERQPDLALLARELMVRNGAGERVTVTCADAREYLPPEPVDLVVCEMLHAALLRERQVEIIADFKRRYLERFESLPRFLPEATLLGVEPVTQDFSFFGFDAPLPLFEDPARPYDRTLSLGGPQAFAIVDYNGKLPERFDVALHLPTEKAADCNALRFITTNVLAVVLENNGTIQWMNQNLILPLPRTLRTTSGGSLRVEFAYRPGDSIPVLQNSLRVANCLDA